MTERSYDTGYWQPPTPYYEGGEASPTTITVGVPIAGDYNCSIDGRRFRLDRLIKDYEEGGTTIPLLRNQIDASADPGEASINREELWRRSRITWYMGAGQQYADRSDNTSASNDARFWTSKGIDPWTRWQLTLLADTTKIKDLSGTNSMLVPLGTRLYLLDGTNIYSTTDTVTWSTRLPAAPRRLPGVMMGMTCG